MLNTIFVYGPLENSRMGDREVLVLDANNLFFEYVHPAIARRLLQFEEVSIYSKDPFAIKVDNSLVSIIKIEYGTITNFINSLK